MFLGPVHPIDTPRLAVKWKSGGSCLRMPNDVVESFRRNEANTNEGEKASGCDSSISLQFR